MVHQSLIAVLFISWAHLCALTGRSAELSSQSIGRFYTAKRRSGHTVMEAVFQSLGIFIWEGRL